MPLHEGRDKSHSSDTQLNGLQYVQQLAFAHVASRVLAAGVFLNIFNVISSSGRTAEEISESTQTSLRGIRILLDALTSFHLLRKSTGKYFLTKVSETYLRKESAEYMGHLWEREDYMLPWNQLIHSVKSGEPWKEVVSPKDDDNSFASLDCSLHVVNAVAAEKAAADLTAGYSGLHVLDVACGSGVWGVAVARKDPASRIVAQDFRGILKLTKHYVESHHVERQFRYLPGNLRKIDFGEKRYNLVILGNILHYFGESFSKSLLKRLYRALREAGRIAIIDIIANEERTAPQSAVAFALVMLLGTAEGDVFTMRQYRDWIQQAGFQSIETVDIGAPSPMIIAHK